MIHNLDEYVCTTCGNGHELCFCGQKPLSPFDDLDEYIMKIKCAWCGLDMGVKPCNEEQHDKISHSICESCKIKFDKEIFEYKGVISMPRGDGQGPPKTAPGPKNGQGGGSGNQSGQGSGPKTGGGKGDCK